MNKPINPLLTLLALSLAARGSAGSPLNPKFKEPLPSLEEMLAGGRQKGEPILSQLFLHAIDPRAPWSEAPEEVKDDARRAIVDGDLEPNCTDAECEFCNWVRAQPEWTLKQPKEGAAAGEPRRAVPGERFTQEYGEGVAAQQDTVPGILREAAATYEQRNPLYGDAYKHYGSAMMAFFPQGLYINEPEDWNRFGLFSMMVSKMNRIANNITTGGHRDSSLDLSVYAAMMTELTEEK